MHLKINLFWFLKQKKTNVCDMFIKQSDYYDPKSNVQIILLSMRTFI